MVLSTDNIFTVEHAPISHDYDKLCKSNVLKRLGKKMLYLVLVVFIFSFLLWLNLFAAHDKFTNFSFFYLFSLAERLSTLGN